MENAGSMTAQDEQGYGYRRVTELPFETALERARTTLQEQGFGVLTEIDLKAKFKEKLNEEFPKYIILGACNPGYAFEAIKNEIDLGLLLPCNVVVYEQEGRTVVAAVKATKMLSVAEGEHLQEIAQQVDEKLRMAIDAV